MRRAISQGTCATPGFASMTPLSGKQPENFSTLNQRFGQVLAIADAADAAPTARTEAVAKELEGARKEIVGRWREIKRIDAAALNELLEREKAWKIDPERRAGETPSADVDGEDVP